MVKAVAAVRSGSLQQPVTTAVTERLDELTLTGVLRPCVTISTRKTR
jgi:hypothetical protein